METSTDLPLFTPGPLTTSRTVKQAMLRDLGSRDPEFISLIGRVRSELLAVAGVTTDSGWECVPMQGSGTFGIESVISTAVARNGVLVVANNGAYGRRMVSIGVRHGIEVVNVEFHEEQRVAPDVVKEALRPLAGRPVLLACVHCETTTGLTNPIETLGEVAAGAGVEYLVDSMSGFGALPLNAGSLPGLTWAVSSSNKCVEGVPGLSFVIGRRASFAGCEGRARTLSLDIHDQWRGLEADGQFRFTPPTHVLLALDQALLELKAEGGPSRRLERYSRIQKIIVSGLRELGYRTLLPDELLSPIITSFRYPERTGFDFTRFSRALRELGHVIYPGKVSNATCFRVGSIGRLRESDAFGLVRAIASMQ